VATGPCSDFRRFFVAFFKEPEAGCAEGGGPWGVDGPEDADAMSGTDAAVAVEGYTLMTSCSLGLNAKARDLKAWKSKSAIISHGLNNTALEVAIDGRQS
jgi:hypothetical protein